MATYWENSCPFGLRYDSWYKYLIVSLVFSHLGFWSGNLFLIAPFPDLCLHVPFHKRPYKTKFIANSSSCTTAELSSCLTAIKSHAIRYCETVYETSNKNWFWSIKNSGEVLIKLKCRGFRATSLSTYDFSTLYTTLPHNLITEKLLDLIEWTFKRALKRYGSLYLACNDRKAFFTSSDQSRYTLWSCQNVCDALSYILDNIYIRFGTKVYRQIVGIPMGTNCASIVADLFLYCYERDFMDSLNHDNQADVIEAFNLTSRYLDDLLNIGNPYFEGMIKQMYPPELQLNKGNNTDTEAPFQTYIFLLQMDSFLLKFMINVMTLILI